MDIKKKKSLAIPQALQPNLLTHQRVAGEHETHQPFQLPAQHLSSAHPNCDSRQRETSEHSLH